MSEFPKRCESAAEDRDSTRALNELVPYPTDVSTAVCSQQVLYHPLPITTVPIMPESERDIAEPFIASTV